MKNRQFAKILLNTPMKTDYSNYFKSRSPSEIDTHYCRKFEYYP